MLLVVKDDHTGREKLSSVEDRGQTDRVTALPRPYALDIDPWPWPVTLTFNHSITMVMTATQKLKLRKNRLEKNGRTNGQTDVRQWGLTYIHTYRPTPTRRAIFHERRISSVTFAVCLHILKFTSQWLADSSDFGLLGEQCTSKWKIPCPRRPWTTVQNLTPLALSSPEKSVTVQFKRLLKTFLFGEAAAH